MSSFLEPFNTVWTILPFGLVGLLSWSVWLVRWAKSRRYRPLVNGYRTTTSVVVPSYREDPGVIERCLKTWLVNGPNEVIVVADLADREVLRVLAEYAERDHRVRPMPFLHHGKRSALGVGIRAARFEIIVLADSDTAWADGLLEAIQMPFVDPHVGGVGSRQNAVERQSSVWRIVADWMVNTRYLDYVPAQGMAGGVACLSGRTAAYRRSVILPLIDQLEHEYFMGRECVAGDDGRLTWLVLGAGFKTAYQGSARAWSMFPNSFRPFVKQRIRWSRNSYRCYLTSIYKGWLWRQPYVTQITVFQILLTPLTMAFALLFPVLAAIHHNWTLVSFSALWFFVSRAVRNISHLRQHPGDIIYLPLVAIVIVFVALPVKLFAFLTMNTHGWLTRSHTSVGGECQSEVTLHGKNSIPAIRHALTVTKNEPAFKATSKIAGVYRRRHFPVEHHPP